MLDASLEAAVDAREDDAHCAWIDAGLGKERSERRPGPAGGADGFGEPGLARLVVRQQRAAVARTLERDGERALLARFQVVEGEHERAFDEAADLEPPRPDVDRRDVEVDEQVVQADRRDRLAEELEREAVVARRELQLITGGHRVRAAVRPPSLAIMSTPTPLISSRSFASPSSVAVQSTKPPSAISTPSMLTPNVALL